MPTPYGSRGAMAFGTEELRVLRRALALALKPSSATAEDVQDCLRLARSVDEAAREGARLRAFLLADLARYRAALPGTATGYLALLNDALGVGHRPTADDLAALRALRGNPTAADLLDRCLDHHGVPAQQDAEPRVRTEPEKAATAAAPTVPASRTRLTALPGGLSGGTSRVPPRRSPPVAPRTSPTGPPGPHSPPPARPSGAARREACAVAPAQISEPEPPSDPDPRRSLPAQAQAQPAGEPRAAAAGRGLSPATSRLPAAPADPTRPGPTRLGQPAEAHPTGAHRRPLATLDAWTTSPRSCPPS
ncbi:hypothetical protein [Streptomyces sp. KM273126]|uniref:hypothetical protein n=1 Tax=Streptomyces sp. KM273126 TaxID=2545247 RepID=UPI00215D9DA8|nr:hypothetical protein [Streptomyces sp. KM273126]